MTYALVIIDSYDPLKLPSRLLAFNDSPLPAGTTKLQTWTWLIELENGLSYFGTLIRHLAGAPNLPHSVAFFDEPPVFTNVTQQTTKSAHGDLESKAD